MNYTVKKIGKTKTNSIQYIVFDSLNIAVAVFFEDIETHSKYRVNFIECGFSSIKDILEVINNA